MPSHALEKNEEMKVRRERLFVYTLWFRNLYEIELDMLAAIAAAYVTQ